jgi:hypothetical protein
MISRLMAKRDELFPHVPLVIERDPTRKLALAMSVADVCLVWPMRTLAAAIRPNGWSESSSLRPSADGIEPWVDPFYALRSSPPPTDTPDGSPESREQRGIARALLVSAYPGQPRRRRMCAKRWLLHPSLPRRGGHHLTASGFLMESGCTYAPTVPVSTSPARS